jgi:ribonuclease Y
LESLEQLAAAKPRVENVYALQAGREIRVIVSPSDVDDDEAALLSHQIAREIEDKLEYPGQVKVTVIRESRAVDVARNHGALAEQNGHDEHDEHEPHESPIQAA